MSANYPDTPGYKTDRPETSRSAAAAEVGRAKTMREAVLELLGGTHATAVGGLTADQCAGELGESVLAVRPRVSELARMNKVADTGERRANASGHRAAVWRLVDSEAELVSKMCKPDYGFGQIQHAQHTVKNLKFLADKMGQMMML